ncbi:GAF domain-containing protein [Pseudonocardia sp. KRD291]|uniref:GAF domain-containing protein n=1 Tax=Pseudonocardia sp. KRD291 TaxID=2792007 RepID=UPI001C4A669F|nr:GAF domain-containing protein [Pseudonocardia sp. KRD291]MBW0101636.1 GAF domain-containing protein [Pseudonocardia sp. KRD291]
MPGDTQPLTRRWWTLGIIAAVLAAAAYVAQVVAGTNIKPWQVVTLTVVGGLATAAVIVLAAVQTFAQAKARQEAEAAADDASELATRAVTKFEIALNDIFLPYSDILSKAVTTNSVQRSGVQAEARRAIVSYASNFIGADRVRACFFELSGHVGSRRLECKTVYDGREGGPSTIFRESNPNHRHVFEQLDKREAEYWPDLTQNRPPGAVSRVYKTFISAPVATDARIYGLLTVDALEPGELTQRHEPFIRLFAQLLAVALKGNKTGENSGNRA